MPNISVVVITLNEERNIGRCLDSVKDIADDIVVIDSLSQDKTTEIARSKGARVVLQPFLGYIEQKNFAITQAQYPYILSLDADEALSEELKQSILEVKQNWNYDAYAMNRLTHYCGHWVKHCGWYPDRKLRLWDSRKGQWEGINPHDRFEMKPGSTIGKLKGDILHYSYYSVEEHRQQAKKFSTLSAHEYLKKRKKGGWIKIIFSPTIKFVKDYFFLLGFLDGYYGFIICRISAWATYNKYKTFNRLKKASQND